MAAVPIPVITPNPFCPKADNLTTTETAIVLGCCGLVLLAIVVMTVLIIREWFF